MRERLYVAGCEMDPPPVVRSGVWCDDLVTLPTVRLARDRRNGVRAASIQAGRA